MIRETFIPCSVGIFDTEYTITDYSDKILVKIPCVNRVDNSGNLGFWYATFDDETDKAIIREMASNKKPYIERGENIISLSDLL